MRRWPRFDPEHGARGAALARQLLDLEPRRLEVLCEACALHNGTPTATDVTIACRFDADRLNLPRVGIEPDAQFLSTLAALGSPFSSQSRCLRTSFSSTYPPAERGFGLIS